jgi:hypothetical protein
VPPAYRPPIGARVCWPTRNASAGPVTIGPSKEKSRPVESVWRYTGSVAPRRSRERSSMPGVQMTSAKAPFVRYWLWFVPRRALLPRPPPGATPRQRRKAPYSFADADWRGPWRLHCACSRLTDVCSELCTGELRVKKAVRLVPFARYSSDGLRAPPPSVPTSTSLGYRPGLGKEARSRNPKAIRGIEAKTRPKGSYSWHSDSTPPPGRVFGA